MFKSINLVPRWFNLSKPRLSSDNRGKTSVNAVKLSKITDFVTKCTQSRGLFICIYYLASRKCHLCVTCSITGSIVYFVFIYLFTYCVLFVLDSEILIFIRESICIYTSCATIPGRFTSLHYVCASRKKSYAFVCKNGNVWNK